MKHKGLLKDTIIFQNVHYKPLAFLVHKIQTGKPLIKVKGVYFLPYFENFLYSIPPFF
jgi:hypothetical protein